MISYCGAWTAPDTFAFNGRFKPSQRYGSNIWAAAGAENPHPPIWIPGRRLRSRPGAGCAETDPWSTPISPYFGYPRPGRRTMDGLLGRDGSAGARTGTRIAPGFYNSSASAESREEAYRLFYPRAGRVFLRPLPAMSTRASPMPRVTLARRRSGAGVVGPGSPK